eukprot:9970336-Heterocapsa_arctica.AAC.1
MCTAPVELERANPRQLWPVKEQIRWPGDPQGAYPRVDALGRARPLRLPDGDQDAQAHLCPGCRSHR